LAKTILKIEFDYDFGLLAISSSIKDYRLCYFINKELGTAFKRIDDLDLYDKEHRKQCSYSIFKCAVEIDNLLYYFISNKSNFASQLLIPQLKNIDYLIKISGNYSEMILQHWKQKLVKIPYIETIFEVNPAKIATKQNLIFDDEDI
jgi:hypothetical protein